MSQIGGGHRASPLSTRSIVLEGFSALTVSPDQKKRKESGIFFLLFLGAGESGSQNRPQPVHSALVAAAASKRNGSDSNDVQDF
jgi:hypothetical protein